MKIKINDKKEAMVQQILYIIGSIFIVPILPILLFMGKKVRKNVPELPEASENITGGIAGNDLKIRLLTLGESAMAGVGVTDHKYGLTGSIAQTLSDLSKKTVHWQVLARNGFTAEMVTQELVPLIPKQNLDIIVIGLGANDTFHINSPLIFKKHMMRLVESIQKRQPHAKIVIANMPPVRDFPAFPWILRQILGNLVDLHGAVIRDLPQRFDNVFYINETIVLKEWIKKTGNNFTGLDFFSDGVHPSAMTYRIWGKEVGEFIIKNVL